MAESLTIPAHCNGPPGSGQGGYTCGVVAALVDGDSVRVSLRAPPPLERPLTVERGDGLTVLDGDTVVAVVMLAVGPLVMDVVFGGDFDYDRGGLVLISIGMGLYLSAATLNQALLARALARQASACWVGSAAGFVALLLLPGFDNRVLQVETAYVAAALVLCSLLYTLYRRG